MLSVVNMLSGCGNVVKRCRSPASSCTKAATHRDNRKLFPNVIIWGLTSNTLPGSWLVFQPSWSWRRAILLAWRHAAAGWSVGLSHESDFSVSAHHCSIWHQQHTWAGQVLPRQPRNRPVDNRRQTAYFFTMEQVAAVILWLLYYSVIHSIKLAQIFTTQRNNQQN